MNPIGTRPEVSWFFLWVRQKEQRHESGSYEYCTGTWIHQGTSTALFEENLCRHASQEALNDPKFLQYDWYGRKVQIDLQTLCCDKQRNDSRLRCTRDAHRYKQTHRDYYMHLQTQRAFLLCDSEYSVGDMFLYSVKHHQLPIALKVGQLHPTPRPRAAAGAWVPRQLPGMIDWAFEQSFDWYAWCVPCLPHWNQRVHKTVLVPGSIAYRLNDYHFSVFSFDDWRS